MTTRIVAISLLFLSNCIYPMYTIERAIADNNIGAVAHIIKVCPTAIDQLCNTGDWAQPLHLAALRGRLKIAQMLLDAGAKPNVKDINRDTPLDNAIIYNKLAVARLLLENGANPNFSTPLHYAASRKNRAAVELLLRFGSSTQRRNMLFLLPRDFSYRQRITVMLDQRHEDHKRLMTLSSALHPRLGQQSAAQLLTRNDLSLIAQYLMNLEQPLIVHYNRTPQVNYCARIAKFATIGGIAIAAAAYLLPYLSNS